VEKNMDNAEAKPRGRAGGRRKLSQLSSKQQRILDFIVKFLDENTMPPTVREIKDELNISSTSVVDYNLRGLEEKGYVTRRGGKSRGIELVGRQRTTYADTVPLLGSIAAGLPIPVVKDVTPEDVVELPPMMFKGKPGPDVFALKVNGYSMVDALINDGDIVLIKFQETAETGETVAVWLESERETTLKKWYPETGNRVRLQPANQTMEPIYTSLSNARIMGKLVGVIRTVA
jgi:repressor LexA